MSIMGGPTDLTNEPVGARLFSGLGQLFGTRQPGTAPSVARMAEMERIARLYGWLPPIPADMLSGLAPPAGAPLPVELPPDRVPPSARPVDSRALQGLEPPVRGATRGIPLPNVVVPEMIPPTIPPELDPSNLPRTPADRPDQRAVAVPTTPGEANWWQRMATRGMDRAAAGLGAAERFLGSPPAPQNDTLSRILRGEEVSLGLPRAPEAAPLEAGTPDSTLPLPPEFMEDSSLPSLLPAVPGSDNAAAMAPARTRYGMLSAPDPDFGGVMAAYNEGRPRERERNPEERMLRLIAAALAGGMRETGLGVAGGAASGLGAGYTAESNRDEELWQRSEGERQRFQQGLAGLMGQQEQARFNNALARDTFNRQSEIAGDADARAREGLDIQRANAGEASMLRRLRMAEILRRGGMETDQAQVFSRGIQHVVANPGTQLLITDDQGRARPLTLRLDDRELTLSQAMDRLTQIRTNPRTNPGIMYPGAQGMAQAQVRSDLADLLLQRIMGLSEAQRMQVARQLLPMIQSRARAGSQELTDE